MSFVISDMIRISATSLHVVHEEKLHSTFPPHAFCNGKHRLSLGWTNRVPFRNERGMQYPKFFRILPRKDYYCGERSMLQSISVLSGSKKRGGAA